MQNNKFTQMIESYKAKGLKSLADMFVKEEASEEEFNSELETAKKKAEGKEKAEVAKASVQAVQNEEVEALDEVKGVAPGDWHVLDDNTGQIHSTHPTQRKALNAMNKLNDVDYDQNKDDPTRNHANMFQHRYSAIAKSYHDEKTKQLNTCRASSAGAKTACLAKEEVELDESSYSAKAAHAGKDIGKPGKNFEKIANKAEKEYGSEEAGKRVAGAVLAKLRKEAYNPKHPKIDLHNKSNGAYIASTNWSPTVKHAVSSYEEKNPHMKGNVKGYISENSCNESTIDEGRSPTPVAGTRKVASYSNDKFGHTAEVRYSPEYNEYQVHHYKDGKHLGEEPVSYHGDDKADAIANAKHAITDDSLKHWHASDSKVFAKESYYTPDELSNARKEASDAKVRAQTLTKNAKTGLQHDEARRAWKEHAKLHGHASAMSTCVKEQIDVSKIDTEELKAQHKSLAGLETPSATLTKQEIATELKKRGISESHLSPEESAEKEKLVKGMKKNLKDFKSRYGDRAKEVMYATATKNAKGE